MIRSGNPSLAARSEITERDRADLQQALFALYDARSYPRPAVEDVVPFAWNADPIAWARAGSGAGGRRFTQDRQAMRMETLRSLYVAKFAQRGPFRGAFAAVGIFYMPDLVRVDGDNLVKLCLDAGNPRKPKGMKKLGPKVKRPPPRIIGWRDDSNCLQQAGFIELDREHPRTLLAMAPSRSSMPRYPAKAGTGPGCVHCGCRPGFKPCASPCGWVADFKRASPLCQTCSNLGFGR